MVNNTLKLYDTLTREQLDISPIDGKTFRYYACGPTVYGPAHIGNFRTFLTQDLFRRVLELSGTETFHVRNLTDVDDKTIRRSQEEGKKLIDFTNEWTERFHEDSDALNILPPHVEPGAVDHIPEQIEMIEVLVEKENAYVGEDGSVYFAVDSFEEYGKLSHLDKREIKLGSGQSANSSDEYDKDSLADFALWKAWKEEDGPNKWESPWGDGRPGWHIECSAMIKRYLGDDFDLHSGGVDLIFPHHDNEIAQSCSAYGGIFANHWFHVAHLMVDGGKMSKSLGNLYTVSDLAEKGYTANEIRYALLSGHYRQPLNFTLDSLHSAKQALEKVGKALDQLIKASGSQPPSYEELKELDTSELYEFAPAWEALLDDLNSSAAMGQFFTALKQISSNEKLSSDKTWAGQRLKAMCFIIEAFGWKAPEKKEIAEAPAEVQEKAQQRWEAKTVKDWGTADKLRDEVLAAGWVIKDNKDGFDLIPSE